MENSDRIARRKSLGQRLGLTGIGCCGATWGLRQNNISVRDEEETEELSPGEHEIEVVDAGQTVPENGSTIPACLDQTPAVAEATSAGMNLAAALAAERHFRAAQDSDNGPGPSPSPSPVRRPDIEGGANNRGSTELGTPFRVSLMRLLEETDGYGGEIEKEGKSGEGCDSMCCVCMGRKKGAAFIPCGHTFCRVCSRELWLNRGFCPLCNRSIFEVLDIF